MFERLINRIVHRLWKPIRWEIRTNDGKVRAAELHQKVLAVGLYRSRSYAHNSWEPPRWDGPRPERAEAAYNGLRWTADLAGEKLHTVSKGFVDKIQQSRVAMQLAEIEARVERAAERWLSEICADVGLTA